MQLEDYFEFDNPNGIRIRGTRINLEDVVYLAGEGMSAGQIRQDLPALSLEQVHAALAYYYRNRVTVDEYIVRQHAEWEAEKQHHEAGERPAVVENLLRLKAERKGKVIA